MSEIELRELDVWICENVFLWELKQHSWRDNPECDGLYWTLKDQTTSGRPEADADFSPTTDPSANRELERKIAIMAGYVQIQAANDGTWVVTAANKFQATALTLELAITLLARKLWEHFEQWRNNL